MSLGCYLKLQFLWKFDKQFLLGCIIQKIELMLISSLTVIKKQITYLLRTPPKAHGIRTSHSHTSKSFGSIESPPLKSFKVPLSSLYFSRAGISIPFGFLSAPVMSLTATTLPPLSWINFAAHEPTFPKPCKWFSVKKLTRNYFKWTKTEWLFM